MILPSVLYCASNYIDFTSGRRYDHCLSLGRSGTVKFVPRHARPIPEFVEPL